MFPALAATDLTPMLLEELHDLPLDLRLVVTSVATQRFMVGSAFGEVFTPAAIYGRVLVVGAVGSQGADGVLGTLLHLTVQVVIVGEGRVWRAATSFGRKTVLILLPA